MPHHSGHHWVRKIKLTRKQQQQLIKRSALAMAIIEPAMTIPQIYEIWFKHETAGVSSLTWGLYIGSAIVWLFYGIQIKDRPLIISSSLWVITETAVLIGLIVNG